MRPIALDSLPCDARIITCTARKRRSARKGTGAPGGWNTRPCRPRGARSRPRCRLRGRIRAVFRVGGEWSHGGPRWPAFTRLPGFLDPVRSHASDSEPRLFGRDDAPHGRRRSSRQGERDRRPATRRLRPLRPPRRSAARLPTRRHGRRKVLLPFCHPDYSLRKPFDVNVGGLSSFLEREWRRPACRSKPRAQRSGD